MKTLFNAALIVLTVAITGCDSKTPPESLTKDIVMKEASKELLHGMEIVDFKRENGWADQNAQNRYIVRYEYKIKLTKDMPAMVLEMAKATRKEVEDVNKNPGFMGLEAMGKQWELSLQAARLNKEEGYAKRLEAFIGRCNECKEYLGADGNQSLSTSRLKAFESSWSYMLNDLNFGLTDEHTVGSKLERRYWVAFMKTEQGWMQAN